MSRYVLNALLLRILLPILILACTIVRPALLSSIYLLVLFYLPFVPIPYAKVMPLHTRAFLKILITISVLTCAWQIAFQLLQFSGVISEHIDNYERIFQFIGSVKLKKVKLLWKLIWVGPEAGMFIIALTFFYLMRRLHSKPPKENIVDDEEETAECLAYAKKHWRILTSIGKYCLPPTLCAAAILKPTVFGFVYFALFLFTGTWLGINKVIGKGYGRFILCFVPLLLGHVTLFYAYQLEYLQNILPKDDLIGRLLGVTSFITLQVDGAEHKYIIPTDEPWFHYLVPFVLYILYSLIILVGKQLITATKGNNVNQEIVSHMSIEEPDKQIVEIVPASASVKDDMEIKESGKIQKKRKKKKKRKSTRKTHFNSLIFIKSIIDDTVSDADTSGETSIWKQILNVVEGIITLIVGFAYIGTIIIMMFWSVTFVSWPSVLFLIWAIILWMVPDKRISVLRSSLFLVIFSIILLVNNYLYGLNLTEKELPTKAGRIRLAEISHEDTKVPQLYLFIRSLYLVMFWITTRQYRQENLESKNMETISRISGVSEAVSDFQENSKVAEVLKDLLTKFWIWLIALFLFIAAVVEHRMSAFRIGYMALFLFLILSFQLSFWFWRKIITAFLWFLVAYATFILLAVYTYQFNRFDEYWEIYLSISKKSQYDIGLEAFKYKTQYIHHIVTPTVLIILTNIQVFYINKEFLKMCDPNIVKEVDHTICFIHMGFTRTYAYYKEQVFRFLEIHMMKLVLFFIMLMSTFDVSASYLVIVTLLSLSFLFGRCLQIFTILFSSCLISIYILGQMIYQIQFVRTKPWMQTTCMHDGTATTKNIAHWLGLKKLGANMIWTIVDWNIGFVVIVTLWMVIVNRQMVARRQEGMPDEDNMVMFPGITAKNSDKSLLKYLKYAINYGFYRLGVEICLIWTAIVIAIRMDMYAILYCVWLCILFSLKRPILRRIWILYLIFLAIVLPFQYFMVVGLPPWVCLEYPWEKIDGFEKFRLWMFLPSTFGSLDGRKILPDFILLMLVSLQWFSFKIERKYLGKIYEGGSNEHILHLYEEPNIINPKNDFITYTKSYLDIFKRALLPVFFWISMAATFITSIYQVNIFYIGYLLMAYIFLWHGVAIYLMPITKVLRRWHFLMVYTVLVIITKTSLQILGCFFLNIIPTHHCWIVQLFAIGCLNENQHDRNTRHYCPLSKYSDVILDVTCFALLLIQRRIFCSYDFFHIVNDVKADIVLGSRGLEILDDIEKQRGEGRQTREDQIKGKIDLKLSRIIGNRQKIQGSYYTKITTHEIAIRSGDYYMFDEVESEDIDILPEIEEGKEEEKESSPGIAELISLYLKRGMDTVLTRRTAVASHDDQSDTASLLEYRRDTMSMKKRDSMMLRILKIIWITIDSCLISAVNLLNTHSKDYREVQRILYAEKQALKEKTNYHVGVRLGPGKWWQPSGSYNNLMQKAERKMATVKDPTDVEEMTPDRPTILKLLSAFVYAVMSESKNICYAMMFLNQLHRTSFLHLPLTLMVFLWATLTVPRPSKTFWIVVMNYTIMSVLLKGMFQFNILMHKKDHKVVQTGLQEDNPFYAPEIIGLYRQDNYAVWDLIVLMAVFMHRGNLKMLGMWKETFSVAALLEDGSYKLMGDDLIKTTATRKTMTNLVLISTKKAAVLDHMKGAVQLSLVKYAEGCRVFFQKLLRPPSSEPADVYTWIFWFEFINLFVVLFGYSSFVKSRMEESSNVASYITSSKIPVHFLIFILILFLIMVIDRALYLRKNIMGKIMFQLLQVLVLHIWLILLFPIITGRPCYTATPPKIFYMLKCFYFLLSAYQIRRGYPSRVLGYFCCKNFGTFNFVLFKIYTMIPFLLEIRTCLDWMLTETSMSIFEWIRMEDIFKNIFIIKCERAREQEFSSPRGQAKSRWVKILLGSGALLALLAILWFPLIIFSMSRTVGVPNIPRSADLKISIGRYEPIYSMGHREKIHVFGAGEFNKMKSLYNPYKVSKDFIYKYDANDVAALTFTSDSSHVWSITALNRRNLIEEVESDRPLPINMVYQMNYRGSGDTESNVEHIKTVYLDPNTSNRDNLLKMLKGEEAQPVLVKYILPKFLAMGSTGNLIPVPSLMLEFPDPQATSYRNMKLMVERVENTEWWKIQEQCDDLNYDNFLKHFPLSDCDHSITIYTFNERMFTSFWEKITSGGILAVYGLYFLTVCKLLKGAMFKAVMAMWYKDMPNGDRIYHLIKEVYLCREFKYFDLEEELFGKLLFLMRSRDLCIKYTRMSDDPYNPIIIQQKLKKKMKKKKVQIVET